MVLYVVRNAFRAHGTFYGVGALIEDPSSIWLFRSRLGARDIIELKPGHRDNKMWLEYLKARSSVPLDSRIIQLCTDSVVEETITSEKATVDTTENPDKPVTTAKRTAPAKKA